VTQRQAIPGVVTRALVILFIHPIATFARLLGPGGIRSVVAVSVLVKQQILFLNRSRQRSPNIYAPQIASSPVCVLSRFAPLA
jgi:hypothetical protein